MADAVPLPMILRDILKKWPPDQPDIVTWDGLLDAALTAEFATALPFREIAQAYVDNFDSARGLRQFVTPATQRQWLSEVACHMQHQRTGETVSIGDAELVQAIATAMRASGHTPSDAVAFRTLIRERMGLVNHDGSGRYSFLHTSFLEFFAAQKLVDAVTEAVIDINREVLDSFAELAGNPLWHETITFAFQQVATKARDHKTLRRALFGDEWETGEPRADPGQSSLLFLRLVNDPYAGFTLPCAEGIAGCQTLADVARRSVRHLNWSEFATDANMVLLTGLSQLTTLYLHNTKATDAGVTAVAANCPQLTALYLSYTKVTDAGVKAIRALRPDLLIVR